MIRDQPARAAHVVEPAIPVMHRITRAEPITCLHGRTNIDSSLIATIGIYAAQSSVLMLIPLATCYVIVWAVLAIKVDIERVV